MNHSDDMDSAPNRQVAATATAGLAVCLGFMLLLALLLGAAACIVGVVGIFQLSPESAALRQSAMQSIGGTWDKKIALRAGGLVLGLARLGLHWAPLDPEPRAALSAVRGADVGVYQLQGAPRDRPGIATLAAADRAMSRRGWIRVVGVSKTSDLVAIYVPQAATSLERVRCCLMVVHEGQLVVVSARGNLKPIIAMAGERMDFVENLVRHNAPAF